MFNPVFVLVFGIGLASNSWALDSGIIKLFSNGALKPICSYHYSENLQVPLIELEKLSSKDAELVAFAKECASLRQSLDPTIQALAGEILYRAAAGYYSEAIRQNIKWNKKKSSFEEKGYLEIISKLTEKWKGQPNPRPFLELYWASSVLSIDTQLEALRRKRTLLPEEIVLSATKIMDAVSSTSTLSERTIDGMTYFNRAKLNIEYHDAALEAHNETGESGKIDENDWPALVKWYGEKGPFSKLLSNMVSLKMSKLDYEFPNRIYRDAQSRVSSNTSGELKKAF